MPLATLDRALHSYARYLAVILLGTAVSVPVKSQVLTQTEVSDLLYIREEEKLAHDIYTEFFSLWGLAIFDDIAVSEQNHSDAILNLINLYGLDDPAGGNPPGVYSNDELQSLYDELIAQGEVSETAALETGIRIEETDISDLELAIANTGQAAIGRVYNNILRGSRNHLAAFINKLEALGGVYPSPGNSNANTLHPGISVFEPISGTLYVPAIDVTDGNGGVRVYDGLFRLVETLPQTLELISATLTDKTPNEIHAGFDLESGLLTIPEFVVGALNFTALESDSYTAQLQLVDSAGTPVFVIIYYAVLP